MSGGGGKSGSDVEETSIPEWLKAPAIRNMQRAEDLQRIEYMPYRGPEVAGFTPSQISAFQNNIDTAKAFGLATPGSVMDGIPTAKTYAGGLSGYDSMDLYDQALAETRKHQAEASAQYDALFGSNVGTTAYPGGAYSNNMGGGSGGGGNPTHNPTTPSTPSNFTPNYNDPHFQSQAHKEQIDPYSYVNQSDIAYTNVQPTMDYSAIKNQLAQEKAAGVGNYATKTPSYSSRLDSKGYTPDYAFKGNPHMGK